MIQVSDTYRALLSRNPTTEFAVAVGKGGYLTDRQGRRLRFGRFRLHAGTAAGSGLREDAISRLTITQQALDSSGITLGQALAGEIDLELYDQGLEIPRQARLQVSARLTAEGESSEWIPQGTFYVDTRSVSNPDGIGMLTIHGYDAMLRAEQDYPSSSLPWPALDTEAVAEIALAMGVPVDARTWETMTEGYRVQLPDGYSCREILAEIAGMYGGNFVIAPAGGLLLVPLWGLDGQTTVGRDVLGDFSAAETVSWTRVVINIDEERFVSAGAEGGRELTISCRSGSEKMAQKLLEKLTGWEHLPYSAKTTLLDPAAEPGDRITIMDRAGVLLRAERHLGPMYTADLDSPGTEEIDNEYVYQSAQTRQENRRYKTLKAALNVLSDKIQAIVENGDESFGWTLDEKSWTIQANGETILQADKSGLQIAGIIQALGGSIGGFEITDDAICTKGMSFDGGSGRGVYLGPDGIRLGDDFYVDDTGHLVANSGEFKTTVYAQEIIGGAGTDGGYIDNAIIETGSLSALKIVANDVDTDRTSYSINDSLTNADFAAAQFESSSAGGYQIVVNGKRFVATRLSRFLSGTYLFSQD